MRSSFLEFSVCAKGIHSLAAITHPDTAALAGPLFAARKEGKESERLYGLPLKSPLYAKGEERVVERSKDRVSKMGEQKEGKFFQKIK